MATCVQPLFESLCSDPGCVKQRSALSSLSSFLQFFLCGPGMAAQIKGAFVFMQKCGHWAALSSAPQPLFQSPPLSLSLFFWHLYPLFLLLLLQSCLYQYSLCLCFSTTMLFRLLTHPYFPPFHSSSFVSNIFTHALFLNTSKYNILSVLCPCVCHILLLSPVCQCSCRRTQPTRCCVDCAGPTPCWRS